MGKVIHLTGGHEHSNINMIKNHMKNKPCIIFIVAPWCGFCKKLEPTINILEKELPKEHEFKRVSIIKVHDTELPKLNMNVKSFPTIKMINNGKPMPDHDEDDRTPEGIRNYIRKNMGKKKSKMKTYKMKKKYKPHNNKGPGSNDPKWVSKSFGIQRGGKYRNKSKRRK
jgi:thiol-disulfide isomerase/thioredoxin